MRHAFWSAGLAVGHGGEYLLAVNVEMQLPGTTDEVKQPEELAVLNALEVYLDVWYRANNGFDSLVHGL